MYANFCNMLFIEKLTENLPPAAGIHFAEPLQLINSDFFVLSNADFCFEIPRDPKEVLLLTKRYETMPQCFALSLFCPAKPSKIYSIIAFF